MVAGRTNVLWLGPDPSQATDTEFQRRGLTLTVKKPPLTEQDFRFSCAIIFCFDSSNKGQSIGLVNDYAMVAAEHGLLVVLHVSKEGEDKLLQGHTVEFPDIQTGLVDLPRPVRVLSFNKEGHALAELAARHPAGPMLNPALKIKGELPEYRKESDSFLLKRAFSDCEAITVEALRTGLSGARVLAVYAEFPQGEVVPYPLPYFAKIDSRERILKEYENYDRFVTRYIPFSQRPNCEPKRCLLGATDGILVGDYVDDSVSLSDVVRPSGARATIHSLFDDALRGWRQQAYKRDRIPLVSIRPRIVEPEQIKGPYVTAGKAFGATLSGIALTSLLDTSAKHLYRDGPMHGDLNTQNIRVRNGEAVLIDFYKSDYGPMSADLASLEIAICFSIEADAAWDDENGPYMNSQQFAEWRRHIDSLFLYVPGQFGMLPPLQERPCLHSWMWSACTQLRLMAHYLESSEEAYACLLVAYLMRLTMFPDDEKKIQAHTPDAIVRGYAYWTAERMLRAIASAKGTA